MKLNIENFAKIKNADIVIDGITVIAGENNTGKSTVGKILFSLFNVLSDIDEKINEERLREIESTNRIIMLGMFDSTRGLAYQKAMYYTRKIKTRIRKQLENDRYVDDEKIYEIINTVFDDEKKNASTSDKNNWSEIIKEVHKNTKEILQLPEKTIILEAISRYFNNVFHSQMQSLSGEEKQDAIITLEIKGKQEKIYFEKNNCISLLYSHCASIDFGNTNYKKMGSRIAYNII